MAKLVSFLSVFFAVMFSAYLVLNYVSIQSEAATHDVSLDITVQEYMAFDITAGDTINIGNFNPGTPTCSNTGSVASVTTNAANGYTLGVHDGSDTDSALVKGGSVYIPDYAGTITTPTSWTGTGLGVGLYAADTNKEAKWGTGTTVCDANNKYAGVPASATTAHTVTGYRDTADTSSWSWKIDTPNDQETGYYSGNVTFTATAVTS